MRIDSDDSDNENVQTPKSSRKLKKVRVQSDYSSDEESEDQKSKKTSNKSNIQSFLFNKTSKANTCNTTANGTSSTSTANSTSSTSTANSISSTSTVNSTSKSLSQIVDLDDNMKWLHNNLEFLKPEKIKDANGRRPNHPDYDEKTLYVPQEYLNSLTPAMRQWWVLKSKHFDTVLFFKVGKFYELYHMDATVGVNVLGFSYMKGEFAHSGFPESAYGRMASSLIEMGYKVARVEQTETPEMMAERCKTILKPTKFDKVVNREICQISSKGACIYGAQLQKPKQDMPSYMMSIAEKEMEGSTRYGVCFVDTSIGTFHIVEFNDDKHSSRLLALLSEHPPTLLLIERGRLSRKTQDILKTLGNIRKDSLLPDSQFFSASKTLEHLSQACYFLDKNEEVEWPPIFEKLMENGTFKHEYELLLKSLGACIWYLIDCKLDIQLLSMKKFEFYHPIDTFSVNKDIKRDYMILDSITMNNLKLLDGAGSLMKTLNRCCTPFGKRLLQNWICRPYCDIDKINERQIAIRELYENNEMLMKARNILQKLPDLERQVAKYVLT